MEQSSSTIDGQWQQSQAFSSVELGEASLIQSRCCSDVVVPFSFDSTPNYLQVGQKGKHGLTSSTHYTPLIEWATPWSRLLKYSPMQQVNRVIDVVNSLTCYALMVHSMMVSMYRIQTCRKASIWGEFINRQKMSVDEMDNICRSNKMCENKV